MYFFFIRQMIANTHFLRISEAFIKTIIIKIIKSI